MPQFKTNAASSEGPGDWATYRKRLAPRGLRLAASTPAELQALLASEIRRWAAVIRAAKIEPE